MLHLVIETFRDGDARPVYRRFAERGRMAPAGLEYVASWVTTDLRRCYQVMACDDPSLLDQWMAAWRDLVDFEVLPVLTSADAATAVAALTDAGTATRNDDAAPSPPRVGDATPILRVADLDASLAHYADALGFALQWRAGDFACVCRGDATLMLCEGDQGRPGTWLYVGVSDADALHDELRTRGATVRHPPTNYPWGARELHVQDPDGHVLRFGADAREGEPLGEWLDGAGVRWQPRPDGSWRRVE